MPLDEQLESCFSAPERKRGQDLYDKDLVAVASASDTSVKATVRASGAPRVALSAPEVASTTMSAVCTCSAFRKGTLCKHIWATILKLEEKGSDFLEGKVQVHALTQGAPPDTSNSVSHVSRKPDLSDTKARQAAYRKQQNERLKERNKARRQENKPSRAKTAFAYPDNVEQARAYFEQNGLPLNHPLEMADLLNAKKLLSRVFHPDKGGTHEESITLFEHFETIRSYLNS
jgi:hypothetical protein